MHYLEIFQYYRYFLNHGKILLSRLPNISFNSSQCLTGSKFLSIFAFVLLIRSFKIKINMSFSKLKIIILIAYRPRSSWIFYFLVHGTRDSISISLRWNSLRDAYFIDRANMY